VDLVKLADTAEMLDAIEGYKAGAVTTDSVRSQVRKQHKTAASGGKAGGFIGSLTTFRTKLEKGITTKGFRDADPGALRTQLLQLQDTVTKALQSLDTPSE